MKVIHSARANATHNHGLDPDRLLVGKWWCISPFSVCHYILLLAPVFLSIAEAFLGKGQYLKRVSYHAKGRSGIRERPRCRLTVVVREITADEEAEIAKLKVHNFRKLTKREKRLVPHKLIETTPIWDRKSKPRSQESGGLASWECWCTFTNLLLCFFLLPFIGISRWFSAMAFFELYVTFDSALLYHL